MFDGILKKSLLLLVLTALVVMSAPAYGAEDFRWDAADIGPGEMYASVDKIGMLVNDPNFDIPTGTENATVTGDSVRVRLAPSIWAQAMEYPQQNNPVGLKKGTRIDVYARTDAVDTINGRTAPWYQTKYEMWIFGGYVEIDPGVEVPIVSIASGDQDLMLRFYEEGLHTFGGTRSEIIGRLGKPISETKSEGYNKGDFFTEMVYDGLIILTYTDASGEGTTVCEVTCTTDVYDFGGIKVGCSVTDLHRIFGDQEYRSFTDNSGFGNIAYYIESYSHINFKIERERVIEIGFWSGCVH